MNKTKSIIFILLIYGVAFSIFTGPVFAANPFPSLRSGSNVANDEVNPGNIGNYVNFPGLGKPGAIAGDADTAVAFNGEDQYVMVPANVANMEEFGTKLNSCSIEFWYKATADNKGKCLMGTINDGANTAFLIERDIQNGRFNLLLRSQGGPKHMMRVFMSPEFSRKMSDGKYHHVVWVVSDASKGLASVYLDGKKDSSASVSGTSSGKFAKFQYGFVIGAANSRTAIQQNANATLDEVALYPIALSASRIKSHYTSGINSTQGAYVDEVMSDSPFAYWRLGEFSPEEFHLVLDDRVVQKVDNGVLRVGKVKKNPANPLFGEERMERPWEVMFNNMYPNVMYGKEEKLYKIWYSLFIVFSAYDETTPEQRTPGTLMARLRHRDVRRDGECYAISKDGIHWEKPNMKIHTWNGKPSNLVATHVHGAGVFKDNQERDPDRRYKMFFKGRNMAVRFSPDGLNWGPFIDCPEIGAAGDAHNNAMWVPELKKYVGFTRIWDVNRSRVVARTESPDFVHWTKSKIIFRGKKFFDIYSMPVTRYGNVYIGLPAIYDEKADRVWTELAWSPDTIRWYRIDEGSALIPNSEKKGDYDWGTVYASFPILKDNDIQIFYGGCDGGHFDWRDGFLCLATLRPDGFAGYEPENKDKPAVILTKPMKFSKRLRITADAENGSVVVYVQDESGRTLMKSKPITGNVTDAKIIWVEGADMPDKISGKKVQLKFILDKAKLYSFLF